VAEEDAKNATGQVVEQGAKLPTAKGT